MKKSHYSRTKIVYYFANVDIIKIEEMTQNYMATRGILQNNNTNVTTHWTHLSCHYVLFLLYLSQFSTKIFDQRDFRLAARKLYSCADDRLVEKNGNRRLKQILKTERASSCLNRRLSWIIDLYIEHKYNKVIWISVFVLGLPKTDATWQCDNPFYGKCYTHFYDTTFTLRQTLKVKTFVSIRLSLLLDAIT